MAAEKIRLGIIGANAHLGWAPRSHLPAAAASPDFELTAVCTTRRESAEESARLYGARLAFADWQDLLACPDIDAVAVVLRVPAHYEPTMAALAAGKPVYTEWPLGQTTAQAVAMADLAREKGLVNMVGLQARAAPAVRYLKELVAAGYVGSVLSCHLSLIRGGSQERPSHRTWQRDNDLGAHTLTIAAGHSLDALRFVVGDFGRVAAVVSTQTKEWLETDSGRRLPVTAPDNVLVSGRLQQGGMDRHGRRPAQQGQGAHPAGVAGGRLQSDEPAHGMADQMGPPAPGGVQETDQPVGVFGDGGPGAAARRSVAGQVQGQHREAPVGEKTGLQLPDGFVQGRPVHHHQQGRRRVGAASAGGGGNRRAVHRYFHLIPVARPAGRTPSRRAGRRGPPIRWKGAPSPRPPPPVATVRGSSWNGWWRRDG